MTDDMAGWPHASFAGLDLLASPVVLLDAAGCVVYVNPATEDFFGSSRRQLHGRPWSHLFGDSSALAAAIERVLRDHWHSTAFTLEIARAGLGGEGGGHLECVITPVDAAPARLLIECRMLDQQLRARREEELIRQQDVHRGLLRNLAHEINNPLGGIRGAAQLLERELADPALREYTQVIINESDRLQSLLRGMLSPHRAMQLESVCIHEILEHVRLLVSGEYREMKWRRDYDTSLPDLMADREQLIQCVLNIVRNAAQATAGQGEVVLRTRPARQVTLAKRRYRLALELQIIDNGPGIPDALIDRIFYPLVSGREGGTGLGLTLAQGFIQQHQGTIDVVSRPGATCFTVLLPLSIDCKGQEK